MPARLAWFLWHSTGSRKRHLGGNEGHCESGIGMKWLPNTDHGTHSRDNVDLGWPRNAKVIGFRGRGPGRKDPAMGQICPARPRSERFAPCRVAARRRIITATIKTAEMVAAFGWRGKCPTRFTTY